MVNLKTNINFTKWFVLPVLVIVVVIGGIVWARVEGVFELPWEKSSRQQKHSQSQAIIVLAEEITEQFLRAMFIHATSKPTDEILPEFRIAYESLSTNIKSLDSWSSESSFLANVNSYLIIKYPLIASYEGRDDDFRQNILINSSANRRANGMAYAPSVDVYLTDKSGVNEDYSFRFVQEAGSLKIDSITLGGGVTCNIFTPELNTENQFCDR